MAPDQPMNADSERDARAEAWLIARHSAEWYIGSATAAEWAIAYNAVDEAG